MLLGGKGGGRKGRYQGKAARLDKKKEVEQMMREQLELNR